YLDCLCRLALPSVRSAQCCLFIYFSSYRDHPDLPSFPTRRSSDRLPPRPRWRVEGWSPASRRSASARPRPPASSSPSPCWSAPRSEEHTSELQSRGQLVCRLLPEKKKQKTIACAESKVHRGSTRST